MCGRFSLNQTGEALAAAFKFLDKNISPETRWTFEQIWHGNDNWECPDDTDIRTGLPTGF